MSGISNARRIFNDAVFLSLSDLRGDKHGTQHAREQAHELRADRTAMLCGHPGRVHHHVPRVLRVPTRILPRGSHHVLAGTVSQA
jgi:hypothetical protein